MGATCWGDNDLCGQPVPRDGDLCSEHLLRLENLQVRASSALRKRGWRESGQSDLSEAVYLSRDGCSIQIRLAWHTPVHNRSGEAVTVYIGRDQGEHCAPYIPEDATGKDISAALDEAEAIVTTAEEEESRRLTCPQCETRRCAGEMYVLPEDQHTPFACDVCVDLSLLGEIQLRASGRVPLERAAREAWPDLAEDDLRVRVKVLIAEGTTRDEDEDGNLEGDAQPRHLRTLLEAAARILERGEGR